MAFSKNPRGRKKPRIVSCRVDEKTYSFIKRHGGGQQVLGKLLKVITEIEEAP